MDEWVMVGIGLALTVGTGLFVAVEFALVNLDRHDLEQRAERARSVWVPPSGRCGSPQTMPSLNC